MRTHFLYKKYSLQNDIKEYDDIRNVVPIFFSKSVLSYLHLIMLLTNFDDIINQPEDLYEYCRYIAKGPYLNMDYFYSNISGESEQKLKKFTNVMFESIEDEIYERYQDDSDKAEEMKYVSLYAYFEEVKKGLADGEIEEDIMEKYINDNYLSQSREIIRIISTTNDLLEFHNILMETISDYKEVHSIETKLREALYSIIKEAHGEFLLYVLRHLHLRIEELKLQNELYDRIIRLSYIYCFNNGLDYPSNAL